MINFAVRKLCVLLRDLEWEERSAKEKEGSEFKFGETLNERMRVHEMVTEAINLGIHLDMEPITIRASLFNSKLSKGMSWTDYAAEARVLRETIEGQLLGIFLYRYPATKVRFLIELKMTWHKAFAAFQSSAPEVTAGVDCYALGHNTACVFHMMRTSEVGLRALARERGVTTVRKATPIDYGTWNDVIKAISDKLDSIRQVTAGPKKDAALAFYNSTISDLRCLQDLYRDRTMHLRESYGDGQAQSAMFRVRSLPEALADKKISDQTAKPIRWGF